MKRLLLSLLLLPLALQAQAELVLRQSTASQAVMIGPFVDSTDGNTAETALTIDAADVRVSKNGANIVGKNSGGCTHDELGYYTCTFDATDTNTVGRLQVMVHETGALPVYHEFQVAEEAVFDACCAASAAPLTATDVWAAATRTLTAGTNINGSTFNAIPWNASWDAEVQSEAEDAINVRLEQQTLADAAVINCTVNTAFFAGSTTTVACILTDRDAGAITAASNDLEGRELLILSGAQIYEGRYITDSTWDGANSELRLTLSRALPGTLADAVTAIIR